MLGFSQKLAKNNVNRLKKKYRGMFEAQSSETLDIFFANEIDLNVKSQNGVISGIQRAPASCTTRILGNIIVYIAKLKHKSENGGRKKPLISF